MSAMLQPAARVLILRLSRIGDLALTLPLAMALKRSFPDVWITWVAQRPGAELLEGHPAVDEVVVLPAAPLTHGQAVRWTRDWLALVPRLRKGRFDVAIDLHGLLKSALLGRLAGVPCRVVFADERREFAPLLDNVRVVAPSVHHVDRHLDIARALGAEAYPVDFGLPTFPEAERWADDFLSQAGVAPDSLVGLVPFPSDWEREWPRERFGDVARRLGRAGFRCVVVGGRQDAPGADSIVEAAEGGAISSAGRTNLTGTAALLRRCGLVIGCDTGPIHIAAAVGAKVIGLYGPTDPAVAGPYGSVAHALWHRQPCGPCGRKPTCAEAECMRAITVEEVLARAGALLGADL